MDLFHAAGLFLYPSKMSRKTFGFYDIFWDYRQKPRAWKSILIDYDVI